MAAETIYFVRHGETYMNIERRCQGRVDTPLNEQARVQLNATAKELSGLNISRIYTSPLLRAMQSAEIIAAPHGIAPEPLEWLTEVDHGELEGMSEAEAERYAPGLIYEWWDHPHTVKFPGGESVADVTRRVCPQLQKLIETGSGTLLLVTHQVVTSVARCILWGQPMSKLWAGKLENGKYLRIEPDEEMLARLADCVRKL